MSRAEPRVVYSTTPPRERGPQPVSHAKRTIASMYDADYVRDTQARIDWLRALTAERWEFRRLDVRTQTRVNAWWTRKLAGGSRFEGGANVKDIEERLTQTRYALESSLAYHKGK